MVINHNEYDMKRISAIIIFLCIFAVEMPVSTNILSKQLQDDNFRWEKNTQKYCELVVNEEGSLVYKNDITKEKYEEYNSVLSNVDLYVNQYNSLQVLGAVNENVTSTYKDINLISKYNCVIDADNKKIIAGNKPFERCANASTTKILTCIIALEYGKLNEDVTVSKYASQMPKVKLGMKQGDSFVLEDLLYSLMLESHNDTAVAIAEHIGGSVEGFAKLMNKKVQDIGCRNTHFVTPNGLDDDNHYTCAYDMCLIASYALKNDDFKSIIQTKSKTITSDSNESYSLSNKDAFLDMYEGAFGVKTGFTSKAGYCFVGAAKRGEECYISCVLACGWPPDKSKKWNDTKKLMDYCFENNQSCININGKDGIKYIVDDFEITKSLDYNKELLSVNDKITNLCKNVICKTDKNVYVKYIFKLSKNNETDERITGNIIVYDNGYIYNITRINEKFEGEIINYAHITKYMLKNCLFLQDFD